MSDITRFIATLKDGDYFIALPSSKNPVLDLVMEGLFPEPDSDLLLARPVATLNDDGKWSYKTEYGTPILEEVGQESIEEDLFHGDDTPRKVGKEELAFILLQCENSNV